MSTKSISNQPRIKKHIHKTNRILLMSAVIYCSCDIVREVKDLTMRANQRIAPLRGKSIPLFKKLRELSLMEKYADHFPESAKTFLQSRNY